MKTIATSATFALRRYATNFQMLSKIARPRSTARSIVA